MLKFHFVLLYFLLLGLLYPFAKDNSLELEPLYITTLAEDQTTKIWQVNPITSEIEQVVQFKRLHEKVTGQLLSENELTLLKRFSPSGEDVTKLRMGLSVEHVIPVNALNLLVVTKNYFCYHAVGTRCFGYYELLSINIPSSNITSIWKVDLNERFTNLWGDCTLGKTLYVKDVLLNPTENLIALILEPLYGCSSTPYEPLATLIINYESPSTVLAEIPYTDNPVWSADGQTFSFSRVSRDCASGSVCLATINTYSLSGNTNSEIINFRIPRTLYVTFNWLTPNTLLYQTTSEEFSFHPEKLFPVLSIYHIETDIDAPILLETDRFLKNGGLYQLGNDASKLIGFYVNNQLKQLSWNDSLSSYSIADSVYQVFHNPRNTDYLLLKQQPDMLSEITLLQSDLQQLSIELAAMLPAGEEIISVVPGANLDHKAD